MSIYHLNRVIMIFGSFSYQRVLAAGSFLIVINYSLNINLRGSFFDEGEKQILIFRHEYNTELNYLLVIFCLSIYLYTVLDLSCVEV